MSNVFLPRKTYIVGHRRRLELNFDELKAFCGRKVWVNEVFLYEEKKKGNVYELCIIVGAFNFFFFEEWRRSTNLMHACVCVNVYNLGSRGI